MPLLRGIRFLKTYFSLQLLISTIAYISIFKIKKQYIYYRHSKAEIGQ